MNDKVTVGQPRPKRRRAAALQGDFVVVRMRRQTATGEVDAPAIKELAAREARLDDLPTEVAGPDSNEHSSVTLLGDADGRDSPGFVLSPRLSPSVHELKFLWRPSMWVDERTIH
jgi:hypothetical protein